MNKYILVEGRYIGLDKGIDSKNRKRYGTDISDVESLRQHKFAITIQIGHGDGSTAKRIQLMTL